MPDVMESFQQVLNFDGVFEECIAELWTVRWIPRPLLALPRLCIVVDMILLVVSPPKILPPLEQQFRRAQLVCRAFRIQCPLAKIFGKLHAAYFSKACRRPLAAMRRNACDLTATHAHKGPMNHPQRFRYVNVEFIEFTSRILRRIY